MVAQNTIHKRCPTLLIYVYLLVRTHFKTGLCIVSYHTLIHSLIHKYHSIACKIINHIKSSGRIKWRRERERERQREKWQRDRDWEMNSTSKKIEHKLTKWKTYIHRDVSREIDWERERSDRERQISNTSLHVRKKWNKIRKQLQSKEEQ